MGHSEQGMSPGPGRVRAPPLARVVVKHVAPGGAAAAAGLLAGDIVLTVSNPQG